MTGSIHIPLPELADRLAEVPEGRVLMICKVGTPARGAPQGWERTASAFDVSSIGGGTDGWEAAGKPISRG